MEDLKKVLIKYHKPPDYTGEWENEFVYDSGDIIVSAFTLKNPKFPVVIDGVKILDNGYRGVYYEIVDDWYDVVRIFDRDEKFIGYYCDIKTPSKRFEGGFELTDLFLDLWVFPDMKWRILDKEEFDEAVIKGWIDRETASIAMKKIIYLIGQVTEGDFPPKKIRELEEKIGFHLGKRK